MTTGSATVNEQTTARATGAPHEKPWRLSLTRDVVLLEIQPGTVVSLEMLLDINRALNSDPAKYRALNLVCDLRDIVPDPGIRFQHLMHLTTHFCDLREACWTQQKIALVVNSEAVFGLGRMYSTLLECNNNVEVRVFSNDFESAIDWAQTSA
jgi:hypothetical protein